MKNTQLLSLRKRVEKIMPLSEVISKDVCIKTPLSYDDLINQLLSLFETTMQEVIGLSQWAPFDCEAETEGTPHTEACIENSVRRQQRAKWKEVAR